MLHASYMSCTIVTLSESDSAIYTRNKTTRVSSRIKSWGGEVCYVRHKCLAMPNFVDHTPYYMLVQTCTNVMMSSLPSPLDETLTTVIIFMKPGYLYTLSVLQHLRYGAADWSGSKDKAYSCRHAIMQTIL